MGKIRVNDLARELDVRSTILLIYISKLGVTVRSHSHPISEELADKVRAHFRALDETPPALPPACPDTISPGSAPQQSGPLKRTIGNPAGLAWNAKEWAAVLGRLRFEVMSFLDALDPKRQRGETPSNRISRLVFDENKLPCHIGALMRTLIAFRNSAEYEKYCPSKSEEHVICSICTAIDEFAMRMNKS